MQPDALDELRARVDQGDLDVAALPQAVGRERSGVSAAEDDDLRGVQAFDHAPKTPAGPKA
nr:hypothetical protein GCM10025732_30770 [Glycomyces mayteni]